MSIGRIVIGRLSDLNETFTLISDNTVERATTERYLTGKDKNRVFLDAGWIKDINLRDKFSGKILTWNMHRAMMFTSGRYVTEVI